MTEDEIKALQESAETAKAQAAEAQKAAEAANAALAKLEANNKALLAEKLEAKQKAEEAALEAARKSGDLTTLEKSWQQKLKEAEAAKDQEVTGYKSILDTVTRGAAAATVAAELFGAHAELMRPHVDGRLRTEIIDGKPQVRVLDAAGNLTALTVDDLKNEFRNNAKFAPFVVASKASGGHQVTQGGGGSATMARSAFDAMDPGSKAKFMKDGGKLVEG